MFFHPLDTHSSLTNNQRSPIIHAVISSTGTGGYNMPLGTNFSSLSVDAPQNSDALPLLWYAFHS